MAPDRIPLFPLDVVLFPGMPLPLHIFEERYKLMIRRCAEHNSEFGVVLARQSGMARVGCTAEVVKIVREYPDGRMDILTAGQTIYRIVEVFEEQPYYEASVEFLDESTGEPPAEPSAELLALYDECHRLAFGRPAEPPDPKSGMQLAFQIAAELPLELESKQDILETPAEADRQERLVGLLKKSLPQLARINRVRARAGGNGHGAD